MSNSDHDTKTYEFLDFSENQFYLLHVTYDYTLDPKIARTITSSIQWRQTILNVARVIKTIYHRIVLSIIKSLRVCLRFFLTTVCVIRVLLEGPTPWRWPHLPFWFPFYCIRCEKIRLKYSKFHHKMSLMFGKYNEHKFRNECNIFGISAICSVSMKSLKTYRLLLRIPLDDLCTTFHVSI